MPSSDLARGNAQYLTLIGPALSPVSVAANTTAEQALTVQGLQLGDVVVAINKPTAQAGLGIVGARVSAGNTIAVTFSNNTGAPIAPTAAEVYKLLIARPSNPGQALPTAFV